MYYQHDTCTEKEHFKLVRKHRYNRGYFVGDLVQKLDMPYTNARVTAVLTNNKVQIVDLYGESWAIEEDKIKLKRRKIMEPNIELMLTIKNYTELLELSTETQGDDFLVGGVWYTPELEKLIQDSNRTIPVTKEGNYYVFKTDAGDFMITEDLVAGTTGTTTGDAQAKPFIPLESCPKVYKKAKTKKNSFPIEALDLCLVDGLEIPQVVTTVDGDNITLANGKTYASKDVFPLYPLDSSKTYEPKLGDVIDTRHDGFKLLTKKEHLEEELHVQKNRVLRCTNPDDKLLVREILKRYTCGGLVDKNGNKISESKVNSRFTPIIEEVEGSLEHEQIAKHYGITVDKVKPKEVKILQTLKLQLDHELSQKDSEWVLLVGPSGSGKTTVGVEYAESKGLEYVIQQGSAQLAVADLLGYKSIIKFDAKASNDDLYVPSLLRDAVENGKVFILDEIDACNPNTLLCLNALKLKEVQFPDKLVKVHPDFRFIATANTLVEDEDYNGRSAMDKATLSRFCIIFYDLAPAEIALRFGLENTIGLTINDKKAYSASEYNLLDNCVLEPKTKLDPRNIQRIVRMRKIQKEGE